VCGVGEKGPNSREVEPLTSAEESGMRKGKKSPVLFIRKKRGRGQKKKKNDTIETQEENVAQSEKKDPRMERGQKKRN